MVENIIKSKNENRVTIGRGRDNDLVLPDPEKKSAAQRILID